ncbi:septum formation family protein [Nocardiopsis sp. CC223A]|uniref:septum formation family protein n=1 Tax=Nocardiopsis sp. CC223A TaxID=3044051 RepID=UPI00278C2B89|nr:septum formation family protein [Nocardiopsis sp. CC223A]
MTDIETLTSQVFPYVKDAVTAYGQAVLSKSEDAAASGTVRHGQRLLAAILGRGKPEPKIENAVRELGRAPEDTDAAAELRDQIRRALREDLDLARSLAAMNTQFSSVNVSGHHNVGVGGNHQGPIHIGDSTSNTHHNVHHTVHNNIQERRISGFSVAALVLGLLGFLILPIPVAIALGLMALTRALRTPSPAQSSGSGQTVGGTAGPGGAPNATSSRGATTGPADPTSAGSVPAAHTTPRSSDPTGVSADAAAPAPDGSAGRTDPSTIGTDPASPTAPAEPGVGADPVTGLSPPPVAGSAAAGTPVTPPTAGVSAPFAPAAVTGFSAAKVISVIFSLIGLLAACLWGLGWTAAAVIIVQAESGAFVSEGTDPSAPYDPQGLTPSVSTGEGRAPSPTELCEPSPGYATVCTLQTGDCFIEPATTEFYEVELTSCDEPHDAQVIGSYSPSGGDWPGWAAFNADIEATCDPMSQRTLDPARAPDTYFIGYIAPNQDSWDYGIQNAFCYVAADGESWTTSLIS